MLSKERYKKHKDIMEKWASGAEIEYRNPDDGTWKKISSPTWRLEAEYRVVEGNFVVGGVYVDAKKEAWMVCLDSSNEDLIKCILVMKKCCWGDIGDICSFAREDFRKMFQQAEWTRCLS